MGLDANPQGHAPACRPLGLMLPASKQVSIRPFTHNEHERFLVVAYPYYASAISVMVGFVVFCAAFLYTGDRTSQSPVAK